MRIIEVSLECGCCRQQIPTKLRQWRDKSSNGNPVVFADLLSQDKNERQWIRIEYQNDAPDATDQQSRGDREQSDAKPANRTGPFSELIAFRASHELVAAIDQQAKEQGRNRSEMITHFILDSLAKPTAGLPVRITADELEAVQQAVTRAKARAKEFADTEHE